jgi:hypothetical protein
VGARFVAVVVLGGVLGVVALAGCAAEEDDAEKTAESSDELSSCTTGSRTGSTPPAASRIVCGLGCPAGYVAQQPLCLSTCGSCNGTGRNAVQCVYGSSSTGAGSAASIQCGLACPPGQHAVQRYCLSTCGSCNQTGSNAVQCSR